MFYFITYVFKLSYFFRLLDESTEQAEEVFEFWDGPSSHFKHFKVKYESILYISKISYDLMKQNKHFYYPL